jgi:hypothetical protein
MTKNVLKNKYVFYAIFVIAIANLLGYLAMKDYESLILFVSIYALSTYFSKKTILNLSVAVLGTALLRKPLRGGWHWYEREGLANNKKGGNKKEGYKENEEKEQMMLLDKKDTEVEKQYNELKNIVGEKNIPKNEKELKEQQALIMSQMHDMAPLMENAKDLIKTFESSGMMKLLDRFMPMLEKVALPGTTGAKN